MHHMHTITLRQALNTFCWTGLGVCCCLSILTHAQQWPTQPAIDAPAQAESPLDTACFELLNRPLPEVGAAQACDTAMADVAADTSPAGRVREARLRSAVAMLEAANNNLPAARNTMNRALALAPEDNIVLGNHGSLLLREGEYRSAVEAYNTVLSRLLEQAPDAPLQAPLYLNRSLALRALGRYDEASKDYQLYLILTGVEAPPGTTAAPSGG
jgi:tetratricopeptide (TPR) repeat protein